MGELFSDMEGDFMTLTLCKRVLVCIERILRILGETLGVTPQHLMATISGNNKAMSKILVMAEALENGMKYMDTLHNFSQSCVKSQWIQGNDRQRGMRKDNVLRGWETLVIYYQAIFFDLITNIKNIGYLVKHNFLHFLFYINRTFIIRQNPFAIYISKVCTTIFRVGPIPIPV